MAPLIKLSKLSHWPAVEINSKQGAPASQVMNILQTVWRGGLGEAADRAGLMRMTLKVAENRKILSFFICMQIRLLHKLTPEPRCQSSSWVEAGPPLGPHGRSTRPLFPSQVSGGLRRDSTGKVESTSFVYCFSSEAGLPQTKRVNLRSCRFNLPGQPWRATIKGQYLYFCDL